MDMHVLLTIVEASSNVTKLVQQTMNSIVQTGTYLRCSPEVDDHAA